MSHSELMFNNPAGLVLLCNFGDFFFFKLVYRKTLCCAWILEFRSLTSLCVISYVLFLEQTHPHKHKHTYCHHKLPPVSSLNFCPVSVYSQSQNKQEPAASLTHLPEKSTVVPDDCRKKSKLTWLFFFIREHTYILSKTHTTYTYTHIN